MSEKRFKSQEEAQAFHYGLYREGINTAIIDSVAGERTVIYPSSIDPDKIRRAWWRVLDVRDKKTKIRKRFKEILKKLPASSRHYDIKVE